MKNFVFLSEIIGLPVVESNTNRKIGKVIDLVANTKELYPKICGIMIKKSDNFHRLSFSWNKLERIDEGTIIVKDAVEDAPQGSSTRQGAESVALGEGEILLKEMFWDKQIVDVSGAKLVRVNDLHLLKQDSNLWVVHVDIGFRGLLRRLGFEKLVDFLYQGLFSYKLRDKFISWKYVQPVLPSLSYSAWNSLRLKVPHDKLSELHPADLADILLDMGKLERKMVFSSFDIDTATNTLLELPHNIQVSLLGSLPKERSVNILNQMPVDEATDFLAEIPERMRGSLLGLMNKEKANEIRNLLSHSEKIVGALMNTIFVSVSSDFTVEQTINALKKMSHQVENFNYIYVVGEKNILIGLLTLKQLFSAKSSQPIAEIMKKRPIKVRVATDRRRVAHMFIKYDLTEIPVVDRQNRLKGIVTIKDTLEAVYPEIEEER